MPPPPPPRLSLVIPAYDEASRLDRTFSHVEAWSAGRDVEVVLVDDGSRDDTLSRMNAWALDRPHPVEVLALPHRGKAAAVRAGMLAASGELVLFSDADLSTPLDEVDALAAAIAAGADVAIGSRELPASTREREPFYRHIMGRAFNHLVQLLVVRGIRDTQCGFKMFTRPAARDIFSRLRRHGPDAPPVRGPMVTAFDVEVLFLARKLGYRVAEVPVRWIHDEGSKVRPVVDAARMLRDVVAVKVNDVRGAYDQQEVG